MHTECRGHRLRRLLVIGGSLFAVLAVGVVLLLIQAGNFLHAPVQVPEDGLSFEIASGTSFAAVCDDLAAAGVIAHPVTYRAYARWRGLAGAVQAGEYRISPGTTPVELLHKFTSGEVQLHSFTLVEGWNQWELLAALQNQPFIDSTLTDEDWPAFLAEIGAEHQQPEGLFLPETYRFPRGTVDRQLLRQAHGQMQEVLDTEWQGRAANLPLATPYEALILASIVEKETARADERARIAGVFIRRLEKRMRLQTDPTVIYGIGKGFNGNLTRRDLQTDTPYNTYTRQGLPPTPIAMPGRAAINAALHPADGDALYFVATGLGDGSHSFSATKEEHDAAVADYLRRLRGQRN